MSETNLADIQYALQDFLLDKRRELDELTLETPRFSRAERLHIYHNAYRLRLIEALANDYPALQLAIGEEKFSELCTQFIAAHPSHHPSLRWLGEKLSEFLRSHPEWQEQLHLIELAEFEWTQVTIFDKADETIASLDNLRALPPEAWMTMQLEFQQAMQLIKCESNAPELWGFLLKDEPEIQAEYLAEPQDWLIWREDLKVVFRSLDASEAWALQAFQNGKNFAEVCEGLCEWFAEEQVPMQAARYLQHWISSGLISKILTPI